MSITKHLLSAAAFTTLLGGCSDAPQPDVPRENVGELELMLSAVPDDARCLQVDFSGSRHDRRRFSLTPGEERSFRVSRLPTGLLTVDAIAFSEACSLVGGSSTPTYVTDSPVSARIRGGQLAQILIGLLRNGRAEIAVDFEPGESSDEPTTMAVIGDTPYGAAQLATLGQLVTHINADPEVQRAVHVGDIKTGSSRCDTTYYETIAGHFSAFDMPLHFTPGDNEWTDCHRANNGGYNPLERLGVLREVFFAEPSQTLGVPEFVLSQATVPAHATFVENQLWTAADVVFATAHVVGSANGVAPWFGGGAGDNAAARLAEVDARVAAALDWVDRAFDIATEDDAAGLALFMQADTFQGDATGFAEVIPAIAARALAFAKPVLLVQGDSHVYLVDQPFVGGNTLYGVVDSVPNLTRIVVQGQTTTEWLKLNVDPDSAAVFTWERKFLP